MRIELFLCRVSRRTQWRFVRLTTTDGRTGYGELSDSGPLEDVPPYLRRIAATLPAHLAEVPTMQEVQEWADAVLGDLPSTRPARTVLGGVEQAVCDLAAQAREQTVGAWLGATSAPSPIPLYANINRVPTGRSPQEVAVAAAEAAAIMPAVKLAPFDVEVPGRPLALAGLDRVRAVRARIGPDVDIMVDCHRKLALAELLPIVDDVAAEGVTWLEDAVEHTDLVGLDLLRSATDVALAGGEFCHERDQLAPAVEAGLLDVVMPDVKHAGGITRAWRLCAGLPGSGSLRTTRRVRSPPWPPPTCGTPWSSRGRWS